MANASAVTLAASLLFTVQETYSFPGAGLSTNPTLQTFPHSAFNTTLSPIWSSTSTPNVAQLYETQKALSGGAATIDLTALTDTLGDAMDTTGLAVRSYHFRNPKTNANDITITFGASNGYLMRGTGWKITLKPGQEDGGLLAGNAPLVDGTHKTIDLAGTGAQALDVQLVFG